MKISELKQPYRRMAEYLAERNTNEHYSNKTVLYDAFHWGLTDGLFWYEVEAMHTPEITPEIKIYFPADFDFSGEEVLNDNPLIIDGLSLNQIAKRMYRKNYMELQPWEQSEVNLKFEETVINKKSIIELPDNPIIQNRIYTQLVKEGKFDELPPTCEFSEPVELEVWDNELSIPVRTNVLGKFKSRYVTEANLCWKYAKLPTQKIDFSEFKAGYVVEVEYYGDEGDEKIVGYIYSKDDHSIHISNKMTCYGDEEIILNQNIKKITKIK